MRNQLSTEENAIKFMAYLYENHLGKSKAIKARNLKEFGDARTIRLLVNSLRKEGIPICSGNSGYWYANSQNEVEEIANKLKSHINDLKDVCAGLDNALFDMAIGGNV